MVRDPDATNFGPVSMLNFSFDGFDAGFLRYNAPKILKTKVNGVCLNYRLNHETNLVEIGEPTLFETEKTLHDLLGYNIVSKRTPFEASTSTKSTFIHLVPSEHRIRNRYFNIILEDIVRDSEEHFWALRPFLEPSEDSSENWKSFSKSPFFILKREYGLDCKFENLPYSSADLDAGKFRKVLEGRD